MRLSPFLLVAVVVVLTAASSVVPLHRPRVPGMLHIGVIAGESSSDLQRAFRPFADLLGQSIRRSATIGVIDAATFAEPASGFDIAVIPASLARGRDDIEVLAWAKPAGRTGWQVRLMGVRRSGTELPRTTVVGDSLLWGDAQDWRNQVPERYRSAEGAMIFAGSSPYTHRDVLHSLAYGEAEAAIVHRIDLQRAFDAGWIQRRDFDVELLDGGRPWLALVATSSLSEPTRDELRAAALNLAHLRYDPSNLRASAVLASLAQVGIGGFAPLEPFPGLRR